MNLIQGSEELGGMLDHIRFIVSNLSLSPGASLFRSTFFLKAPSPATRLPLT